MTAIWAVLGFLSAVSLAFASFAAGHASGWRSAKVDSIVRELRKRDS
jgi:hypothetical protein